MTLDTPLGVAKVVVAPMVQTHGRSDNTPLGLRDGIEALETKFSITRHESRSARRAEYPPTVISSITVRVTAISEPVAFAVSATLPTGAWRGDFSADEDFTALEISTDSWALAIGGPDYVSIMREARSNGQPKSWKDIDVSEYGPAQDPRRGILWHLPSVSAGEEGRLRITFAWTRAEHPLAVDSVFDAVTVDPEYL